MQCSDMKCIGMKCTVMKWLWYEMALYEMALYEVTWYEVTFFPFGMKWPEKWSDGDMKCLGPTKNEWSIEWFYEQIFDVRIKS